MKSIFSIVVRFLLLVFILLTTQAAWAGNWVLDRYEVTQNFTDYHWSQSNYGTSSQGFSDYHMNDSTQTPVPENTTVYNPNSPHHIFSDIYAYSVHNRVGIANISQKTTRLTITPVYKWVGAENEQPSPSFYIRERSFCDIGEEIQSVDFTSQNPYNGQFLTVTKSDDGFGEEMDIEDHGPSASPQWWYTRNRGVWRVSLVNASPGALEVRGSTRTLRTTVDIVVPFNGDAVYGVSIHLYYQAEVCQFELGLDLGDRLIEEFGGRVDPEDPNSAKFTIPHNRYLAAYADGNWTNQWVANLTPPGPNASPEEIAEYEAHLAKPYKFFWDGNAGYSVNMSSNLSSMQVPATSESWPQYEWQHGDGGDISKDLVVTAPPPLNQYDTQGFANLERQILDTDTKTKDLHHNVQEYPVKNADTDSYSGLDATWPRTTHIKAKSNFSESVEFTQLESQAKIDWYGRPSTYYRFEVETDYINLDTGEKVQATVVFDDPADAYAQEVMAAKQEFFATFDQRVGMPLRMVEQAYLVGIEFVVPDEWDLVAAGVGPAGPIFKKSFKATKGVIKFAEFVAKLTTKLAARSDDILAAGRVALNAANDVPIIARTRMRIIRMRRGGKLSNGETRQAAELGEVGRKTCWTGRFCFAAGTQVVMGDGSLKPIEQLKSGETVLSKDELTGEIAPKRILQPIKRDAPRTVILTFNNGEQIETTEEHPFYVEHKGFLPVGLLAVGNSIATRAGPSLTITGIGKKSIPTTVYNFTVEDFHTYFVGNSNLWVHNIECKELALGINGGPVPLRSFVANLVPHAKSHWDLGLDIAQLGHEAFVEGITKAMNEAKKIHFNLDGMGYLDEIVIKERRVIHEPVGSTNWELQQIVDNPALSDKTKFWANGQLYDSVLDALRALGYNV